MKFLIFLGTVRDSTPPKPARLGVRVALTAMRCLKTRYPDHDFELVDALDYPLASGEQREKVDPHALIRDFKQNPSQRNAPTR